MQQEPITFSVSIQCSSLILPCVYVWSNDFGGHDTNDVGMFEGVPTKTGNVLISSFYSKKFWQQLSHIFEEMLRLMCALVNLIHKDTKADLCVPKYELPVVKSFKIKVAMVWHKHLSLFKR